MFKKGELVIKIIEGGFTRTATVQRVQAVKKGAAFIGDGREQDDVNAFWVQNGRAVNNFIPGFTSYIVALDDGEERNIREDNIP